MARSRPSHQIFVHLGLAHLPPRERGYLLPLLLQISTLVTAKVAIANLPQCQDVKEWLALINNQETDTVVASFLRHRIPDFENKFRLELQAQLSKLKGVKFYA